MAKVTGLSKDVIRVWERRYGLVKPLRSGNRYRQYTDEDVSLLRFLKEEQDRGQTIGSLAAEGRDSLLHRMRTSSAPTAQAQEPHHRLVDELVSFLDPLQKTCFEQRLNEAIAVIPFEEAIQRILFPLQRRVGELWHQGVVNVAVEHYVTKIVQQKLFSVINQLPFNESGPRVVIACPKGDTHEIGAQAVAYFAATRGCQAYYLGSNVPVSDLGAFCERIQPDLILLSLTEIKSHDTAGQLLHDLEPIAKHWPVGMGGEGAIAMAPILRETNIELYDSLSALHSRLLDMIAAKMLSSRLS